MKPKQIKPNGKNVMGSRRVCPQDRAGPELNRIAEVIEREQVSLRSLAKRRQLTKSELLASIDSSSDLRLSELYQWQEVLQVPVAELLVEPEESFSEPVHRRTQLLKAMRTVRSIQEIAQEKPVQKMALNLVKQILEMMPELNKVPPWPSVGQRRTLDEMGAIVDRCMPEYLLQNPPADMSD